MRSVVIVFVALLTLAGAREAVSEPLTSSYHGQRYASSFMRIYGQAQPPYGFVHFCERHPRKCVANAIEDRRFEATPERLSELDEINRLVNTTIAPVTDQDLYGVAEFWTMPTAQGDCEDYALLKRALLMARGWPASALLLTVVRDEAGDGHAVLTARTAQGDFILDNKVPDVRIWNATPYQFVMRQSFVNPRVWVSLEESLVDSPTVMAGADTGR